MSRNARELATERRNLEAMLLAEFPLARAMGLGVHAWDGERLELGCPLHANTNAHQSAFAGSQFSLAALCGWSLTYLALARARIDASILFVNADIACQRPLTGDLLARCDASMHPEIEEEIARVANEGKCRLRLTVTVDAVASVDAVGAGAMPHPGQPASLPKGRDLPASVLHGTYALRRRDP